MHKKIHIFFLCTLTHYSLFANPQGANLKSGDASFSHSNPSTLTIHTSDQAIIHWENFSIGKNETTQFVMPSSASSVLNRVIGGNLSQIHGTLESNGKVFLINPKGIIFGKDAQINAASFFASTLDALDADFLKGSEIEFSSDSKSSIINLGTISAWDGDLALIAYHIDNRGILEAKNGIAGIAAGTNVLLSPQDNQRILIRACSLEPQEETVGINNSGTITALQAELKADGNPYQFAIKDSGHIDALSVEQRGGHLYLVAENGRVDATGTYMATNPNGLGGQIHLLGKEIYVDAEAMLDVSGSHGGGTVLIGGDYQGQNPAIPNSQFLLVGSQVQVNASAKNNGDGGKVILWSDQKTCFLGTILAKGGTDQGDGGFAEVSSPQILVFEGLVDLSALNGHSGNLLLDPADISIVPDSPTPGYPQTSSNCPNYFTETSDSGWIKVGALQTCLATNDVTINSTVGRSGLDSGEIFITTPIEWTSDKKLTLLAQDSTFSGVVNAMCNITAHNGGAIDIQTDILKVGIAIGLTPQQNVSLSTENGDITINARSILIGQSSNTYKSTIESVNGNISLTPYTRQLTDRYLHLTGGSGPTSNSLIQTTNGNILIADCDAINLKGGSGSTSNASIQTLNTGTISVNNSSSAATYTLEAGSGSVDSSATFYSGSGDITLSGGKFILKGGFGSGKCVAEIKTLSGGNINITSTGNNNTDVITMTGGSVSSSSRAIIATDQGGNIFCTANGNYHIAGGTGPIDSRAGFYTGLTSGSGNITLTGSGYSLIGGASGAGYNSAEILAPLAGGVINITSTNNPLSLIAGGATTSDARIESLASGNLNINNIGSFTASGGSGATTSRAIVATGQGGDITITGQGDYTITGGNSPFDSRAGIYAGLTSGSGNITLTGAGYSLIGGASGTGTNTAEIRALTGAISVISNSGALSLQGGGGSISDAQIITQTSGNITILKNGDFNLTGGSGASSNAEVNAQGSISSTTNGTGGSYTLSGGSGASSLAQFTATSGTTLGGYDFTLNPGTSTTANGSNAVIESTGQNSFVTLRAKNHISLSGNAMNNQSSLIQTTAINGSCPIKIWCKSLELNGGTALSSSSQVLTNTGPIQVIAKGNVLMTAGSASGADAWIHSNKGSISLAAHNLTVNGGVALTNAGIETQMGNIQVLCTGNCTYTAPTATGLGLMRTLGSDLFVTALGSINLSGYTLYSTPDPGHMRLIAGSNITIGADVQVIANGTSDSSLTLVVDALYPISPLIGPGTFILDNGSTLSAGATTPVRIFTARRNQNTVNEMINGVAFSPGTQFVDSPTEQWGVYFPDPILGDPFTFFYKESNISPIIPVNPIIPFSKESAVILQRAAFVDSEGFYDLADMDAYAFDDTFYFSDFDVCLEDDDESNNYPSFKKILTAYDVIDDKGLSIRKRQHLRQYNLK